MTDKATGDKEISKLDDLQGVDDDGVVSTLQQADAAESTSPSRVSSENTFRRSGECKRLRVVAETTTLSPQRTPHVESTPQQTSEAPQQPQPLSAKEIRTDHNAEIDSPTLGDATMENTMTTLSKDCINLTSSAGRSSEDCIDLTASAGKVSEDCIDLTPSTGKVSEYCIDLTKSAGKVSEDHIDLTKSAGKVSEGRIDLTKSAGKVSEDRIDSTKSGKRPLSSKRGLKRKSGKGRGKAVTPSDEIAATNDIEDESFQATNKSKKPRRSLNRKGSGSSSKKAVTNGTSRTSRSSGETTLVRQFQKDHHMPRRSLPVLDDMPHRFVQPLIQLFPIPSSRISTSVSLTAEPSSPIPRTPSSSVPRTDPDLSTSKTPPTNIIRSGNNHCLRGQNLWPLLDLYLPHPDTYSLAYYFRLLGWNLPVVAKTAVPISWQSVKPLAFPEMTQPISWNGKNGQEAAALIGTQGTWAENKLLSFRNTDVAEPALEHIVADGSPLPPEERDPSYQALLQSSPPVALSSDAQYKKLSTTASKTSSATAAAVTTNMMTTAPVNSVVQNRFTATTLTSGLLDPKWWTSYPILHKAVSCNSATDTNGNTIHEETLNLETTEYVCHVQSLNKAATTSTNSSHHAATTATVGKNFKATTQPLCKLTLSKKSFEHHISCTTSQDSTVLELPSIPSSVGEEVNKDDKESSVAAEKSEIRNNELISAFTTSYASLTTTAITSAINNESADASITAETNTPATPSSAEKNTGKSSRESPFCALPSLEQQQQQEKQPDIPLGWAVYGFEWYPLKHGFELIMVIHEVQSADATSLLFPDLQTEEQSRKANDLNTSAKEIMLVLILSLVLEHARRCRVWYVLVTVPAGKQQAILERYFRMTAVKESTVSTPCTNSEMNDARITTLMCASDTPVPIVEDSKTTPAASKIKMVRMVCDIHKCSSRYSFLSLTENSEKSDDIVRSQSSTVPVRTHRWLARLPNLDDIQLASQTSSAADVAEAVVEEALLTNASVRLSTKKNHFRKPSLFFTGAPINARQGVVTIRVKRCFPNRNNEVVSNESQQTGEQQDTINGSLSCPSLVLYTFDAMSKFEKFPLLPSTSIKLYEDLHLDLMRNFVVPQTRLFDNVVPSEILIKIFEMQQALHAVESGLQLKAHELMVKVVDERLAYEREEVPKRRFEEELVLKEYRHKLELRKEVDLLLEQQRQQDMEAVCDICHDGEVIPENQILFCEACNVAVHQVCYNVERIPEGDYYCIACRYFGRRRNHTEGQDSSSHLLTCELCPRRKGAFIRTKSKREPGDNERSDKWVHMVCAKWQGVNLESVDTVEDVTELKYGFRRLGIRCCLCLGERGGMNQCSAFGCEKWLHVTCARAVGCCNVVHGDNVHGEAILNSWTLKCREHSDVKIEDIPKDALSVERLIIMAQEFPPEPPPPPEPIALKPFNIATGIERNLFLKNKTYEREFLEELLVKKVFGVRCEVCDEEMDSKVRNRCNICNVFFCNSCNLDFERTVGTFTCASCIFILEKKKAGESFETPQCIACFQKDGWLRKATATPVSRKSHWHQNKKEFGKSMFGKPIWTHSLCTIWNSILILNAETGVVDCSNVVLSNGRSLIKSNTQCLVCGQNGGLKLKCAIENCYHVVHGQKVDSLFHVTCARQAGLDVSTEEIGSSDFIFRVKCYRHGENNFNFRAKLEDFIEIERRRSGLTLSKADVPMSFAHASRLLHSAIYVMRVLGWVWRWAEWYVDFNSTWEPLLDEGQIEENMTKEELKIVASTRESRCKDARACRLAAFGAALRNRDFDLGDDDYDRDSFDRALRAILCTKSLCGPLVDYEVEFFTHWLGLAYWSKSRLLGFGENKIDVNYKSPMCIFSKNNFPKFLLNSRLLPGKCSDAASELSEADEFMVTELALSYRKTPTKPSKSSCRQPANSDSQDPTVNSEGVIVPKGRETRSKRFDSGVSLSSTTPDQPQDSSLMVSIFSSKKTESIVLNDSETINRQETGPDCDDDVKAPKKKHVKSHHDNHHDVFCEKRLSKLSKIHTNPLSDTEHNDLPSINEATKPTLKRRYEETSSDIICHNDVHASSDANGRSLIKDRAT